MSVQHVCEEFVPVPVPVHVAYPVDPPVGPVVVGPVGPTPTPQPLFTVSARGKREAGPEAEPEADLDMREIQEIVRKMLLESTGGGVEAGREERPVVTFPSTTSTRSDRLLDLQVTSASLPNLTPVQKTEKLDPSVLGSPLLSLQHHPPLVVSPHPPPPPPPHPPPPHIFSAFSPSGEREEPQEPQEHPPLVTTYELPQQYPGCRSIATKTCNKNPHSVDKKVPKETCRDVPDIECYNVIKVNFSHYFPGKIIFYPLYLGSP